MKKIHVTRCVFLLIALLLPAVGSSSAEEVIGEHVEGLVADDLLPLREWTHEFVVVEGAARGEYRTISFTRDPETENGWITVQGYLLDFSIVIDLTLADVDVRFEYGVSPGRGLLYRRSHWVLEALDVFDRSGARAILLDES